MPSVFSTQAVSAELLRRFIEDFGYLHSIGDPIFNTTPYVPPKKEERTKSGFSSFVKEKGL